MEACRAEPDVGIMSDYVDDWHIVEIAGRPLRKKESADWLYRRIFGYWPNQRVMMLMHVKKLISQNAEKLLAV